MSDGIGSALIGALSEVFKKQPVPGMPGQPPQIGAQPQPAPAPVTNAPARIGALPAQPATAPGKIGAQPTQPSTTIGAPPVDYAAQYAQHAAERPADLDPNAGKPSLARKIGGIATGALIGAVNPQAGGMIGRDITQGPRRELEAQQAQKMAQWNQGGADISKEASLADTQSQIAQRNAEAVKDTRAPETKPGTPEEQAMSQYISQGMSPADARIRVLKDSASVKPAPTPKNQTLEEEYDDAVRTGDTARAGQIETELRTVANAKREPKVATEPGTWTLQEGQDGGTVMFNSKTGQTKAAPSDIKRKPTADEQRRADLATNMNENMDALEDILKRRPELFGPVAGRVTSAKEAFGTSDTDVARLKTIKEFMGMAAVGAHSMRNAQHVEAAANSIVNGFNNKSDAILASIGDARNSLKTFQNDVNTNPQPSSGATPSAKSASLDDVKAYAQSAGISVDAAKKAFKDKGYTVK